MIWIADAHCGDGKRFVVAADEKLTSFRELEAGLAKYVGDRAVLFIDISHIREWQSTISAPQSKS
jgi:hypothetical protein